LQIVENSAQFTIEVGDEIKGTKLLDARAVADAEPQIQKLETHIWISLRIVIGRDPWHSCSPGMNTSQGALWLIEAHPYSR
jgi:hypothetical protein